MTQVGMPVNFFWPHCLIFIKYGLITFTFWTYGHGFIFTTKFDLWKTDPKDLGFILE